MGRWFCVFLVMTLAICGSASQDRPRADATIHVILWFDTEDYILPASDDAALRLATWLCEQGIRATFKVVGEKARTLERRGRTDVIEALKKHEIGYHSNWHSVPPTPAQYLNDCGWEDGIAEFNRRERQGFDDVARIFGQKPTCYGQPGSSWAPQTHAALRQWGVPIYLDAGHHVNVEGKPFWYGGVLNFYKLTHQLRTDLSLPQDVVEAEMRFATAREQIIKEGSGCGVVSIVYHPCEFVHKQFWDGVNFRKGANPPRAAWQLPPMKSETETKMAYANFERFVLFMKRFGEVKFSTATEAARDYPDRVRDHVFTAEEILALSQLVMQQLGREGISWVPTRAGFVTPAELFWLMTSMMAGESPPSGIRLPGVIWGPSQAEHGAALAEVVPEDELRRASREVLKYLEERHQIPSTVWIGSKPMPPTQFLAQVAIRLYHQYCRQRKIEREWSVDGLRAPFLQSRKCVAEDGLHLWKWVIFPEGFQAPRVMEMARRQAWTLKPAEFQRK